VESNVFLEATGFINSDGTQLQWNYSVEKEGIIEYCTGLWTKI